MDIYILHCTVTKVTSEPFKMYELWWINVDYVAVGVVGKTRLSFKLKADALKVKKGFEFQA